MREVLQDYVGARVRAKGVYDSLDYKVKSDREFAVVLLQDVEVMLAGGWYVIGHTWVQHAETMKHLGQGDRVEALFKVKSYYHKSIGEIDYGLTWPSEVKVLRVPAVRIPAPLTPALLKKVGGWERLVEVRKMAERLGGWGPLEELGRLINCTFRHLL